jgi:hypothetical protein
MPVDVELTSLSGTASPEVATSGGAGISLRSAIAGPALEMVGCATSQGALAGFIEALKDIDGVTRVGVQGSSMSGGESGGGNATTASACGGSSDSAQFQLVAAFDAAPVPPSESGEEVAPEVTAEASSETTSSESSSSSEESSSGEGGTE